MPVTAEHATVFLVDPDPAARRVYMDLLEQRGLHVRPFDAAEPLLETVSTLGPGVVVTENELPGLSGIALLDRLEPLRAAIPVIFLCAKADVSLAMRAVRAGAFDFFEKQCDPDLLRERISAAIELSLRHRIVLRRESWLLERLETLSGRELETMTLMAAAFTTQEIADQLHISVRTAEKHRARVLEKMQVASVAELILLSSGSFAFPPPGPGLGDRPGAPPPVRKHPSTRRKPRSLRD